VTAAAVIAWVQAAVLVVYSAGVVWLIVRSRRRWVTGLEVAASVGVAVVAVVAQAVLLLVVDGLVGLRAFALLTWMVLAAAFAVLLNAARKTPRH
jgi:hypothetical protein